MRYTMRMFLSVCFLICSLQLLEIGAQTTPEITAKQNEINTMNAALVDAKSMLAVTSANVKESTTALANANSKVVNLQQSLDDAKNHLQNIRDREPPQRRGCRGRDIQRRRRKRRPSECGTVSYYREQQDMIRRQQEYIRGLKEQIKAAEQSARGISAKLRDLTRRKVVQSTYLENLKDTLMKLNSELTTLKFIETYKQLAGIYSQNIVGKLASANFEALEIDVESLKVFGVEIACDTIALDVVAKTAQMLATNVRDYAEASVAKATLLVTGKNNEIKQMNSRITILTQQITKKTNEVVTAQARADAANQAVVTAQASVDAEWQKNRDANNNCLSRRKRGWFKDRWDDIRHAVQRPLCQVFNQGGIDRSERHLDNAKKDRQVAKNKLNSLIALKKAKEAELQKSINSKNQNVRQLIALQAKLTSINQRKGAFDKVVAKFSGVTNHLNNLVDGTKDLRALAQGLENFEQLLVPLKDIAEEINTYHSMPTAIAQMQIPAATLKLMSSNMNYLVAKLPAGPFIIDSTSCV